MSMDNGFSLDDGALDGPGSNSREICAEGSSGRAGRGPADPRRLLSTRNKGLYSFELSQEVGLCGRVLGNIIGAWLGAAGD